MFKFKTIAEIYQRYERTKISLQVSSTASSVKSPQLLYTRNLKALFVDFNY